MTQPESDLHPCETLAAAVGQRASVLPRLSRRDLLKTAAATCGAMALPHVIPASALGRDGRAAPSERIVMGGIGIGGRGGYDLSILLQESEVQFVAVCDVQKSRRDAAKNLVDARYANQDCSAYRDLRDLLAERTEIDAVLIATGDRWHTVAAITAMKAGKDVFCEKPCTMSVTGGQALVEAARRHGRIFQAGMQRLSEANFVFADELARSGRLGQVQTIYAHILPFQMRTNWLPAQPEPERETLDWDLWLGPAPWRPYNAGYLGGCGAWLDYYDFGTGVAGWGSHTICQCQSAINALQTSPVEFAYPPDASAEGFTATFAGGVRLVLTAKGWRGSCGVRYEGSEGWVSVADGYQRPDVSSPSLLQEFDKVVRDYTARSQRPLHHLQDFLIGVRTRRPCVADEVVTHRTMSTNHIANVCMLLQRNVKWDPQKEEFVNDPEANRLRSRTMRAPWGV